MSQRDIEALFEFANMEFSTEESRLSELRQFLLLELKSSSSQTLNVHKRIYTRQNILELFERPILEDASVANKLLEKHPELKLIENPAAIQQDVTTLLNSLQTEELEALQTHFRDVQTVNYQMEIKRKLEAYEFMSAATLLSYLPLLSPEAQLNLRKQAQEIVLRLVKTRRMTDKSHFLFITWSAYYTVVQRIHDGDNKFLFEQMHGSWSFLKMLTYDQVQAFFRLQQTLDFSEFVKVQLKEQADLHTRDYVRKNHTPAEHPSENLRTIITVVVTVLFLVLILAFLLSQNN